MLPLAAVLPHWYGVLRSSPVDRANLLLWGGLSLVFAVFAVSRQLRSRENRREGRSGSLAAFYLLLPVYAVFAFGLVARIWLVSMTAAVTALFLGLAAGLGWLRAAAYLPALAAMLLAVPGVIFWGERMGSAFADAPGPACELRFEDLPADALSRKTEVTAGEKALFRTSKVVNWDVAIGNTFVSVSEVTLGEDVHEIHPPSFCLKSHGLAIIEEHTVTVARDGETPLPVTETVAGAEGQRKIVWTWYSDGTESTASFVRFRLKAQDGVGRWKRYTLTADDGHETRAVFRRIVESAKGTR